MDDERGESMEVQRKCIVVKSIDAINVLTFGTFLLKKR